MVRAGTGVLCAALSTVILRSISRDHFHCGPPLFSYVSADICPHQMPPDEDVLVYIAFFAHDSGRAHCEMSTIIRREIDINPQRKAECNSTLSFADGKRGTGTHSRGMLASGEPGWPRSPPV